jgi:hypothetical protein
MLIPQMLASGISYNMFLPYIDYYMDLYMKGPITLPYNAYCAVAQWDIDKTYDFDLISVLQTVLPYDFDLAIMIQRFAYFGMYNSVRLTKDKSILCDGLFKKTVFNQPTFDVLSKKHNIIRQLSMDFYNSLSDINKELQIDSVLKGTKRRFLRMENNLVFQNTQTYATDIVTRLFAVDLDIDILTKRTFPKRQGMTIKLVGA